MDMTLPREAAVMILPNVTLFPQALLPLFIFEPRYRQMLEDSLEGTRMFAVAMQKPGRKRETPVPIAGLGLIRASVQQPGGTSHLVLQGVARVQLAEVIQYKPYRIHKIRAVRAPHANELLLNALIAKVRELLEVRFALGIPLAGPPAPKGKSKNTQPAITVKEIIDQLGEIGDPEQVADLVCCTVLRGAQERQAILETVDLVDRFKQLLYFLATEIQEHNENNS